MYILHNTEQERIDWHNAINAHFGYVNDKGTLTYTYYFEKDDGSSISFIDEKCPQEFIVGEVYDEEWAITNGYKEKVTYES